MPSGRDFASSGRLPTYNGAGSSTPPQAGAITPLLPSDYDPAYGGHPAVPNPVATAGQAIAGNIGNLGQLYHLAGSVNTFNNQQLLAGLQHNLPGYSGMSAQSSANIASLLHGNVPNDVINQILQGAAERGITTGGGPNANAAYLRALGLTSLGLQSQGENELTGAVARTPTAQPFNPASMFVTPGEMQGAANYAATIAGSPVPAAAAAAARAAARRGLTAGAGSVPGYSSIGPLPGGSSVGTWGGRGELPTVVGASTGTGTYHGGTTVPESAGAWSSWLSGGGGGGSGMSLDDMAAYLFGDDESGPTLAGGGGGDLGMWE